MPTKTNPQTETTADTIERHEREIRDLDERTNRIGNEVRQANLRAREAHVGYIEFYGKMEAVKEAVDNVYKNQRYMFVWLTVLVIILGLIEKIF